MTAHTRTLISALLVLVPGALAAQDTSRAGLSRDLDRLKKGEQVASIPPADSVSPGSRNIAAGTTVKGTVIARGAVDVFGRVDGSVVSLAGDVTVHRGGIVTGDALSVGGRVNADSGQVGGEMRAMSVLPTIFGTATVAATSLTPAERTAESVKNVGGSFCILLIIAVGVLLFAGPNLDEVVVTIQGRFARAFWYGVLGQVFVLPGLLVLIVALALTILGILLIPFAIVAYAIAVAGLVTLGFLAVARLVGGAVWRGGDASTRGRALGGLFAGVAIFFVLWIVGSLLAWAPLAATVVRAAALAATWAAMTLGLGAAILSRAGTHRRVAGTARPVELAAWQTPTPVAGVVAARRTVSAGESR
ncbi:MAG: polymer-forming cytoskeletal protein [bacterium]